MSEQEKLTGYSTYWPDSVFYSRFLFSCLLLLQLGICVYIYVVLG